MLNHACKGESRFLVLTDRASALFIFSFNSLIILRSGPGLYCSTVKNA